MRDNTALSPQAECVSTDTEFRGTSLVDVFVLVIRHFKLFLALFLISVLAAGLISLFTAPEYESRAVVAVAEVPALLKSLLPATSVIVGRLKEQHDVLNKSGRKGELPVVQEIREFDNLIVISARGRSAKEVKTFLRDVVDKVIVDINRPFPDALEAQKTFLAAEEQKKEVVLEQLRSLSGITNGAARDITVRELISLEKAQVVDRLSELEKKILSGKLDLLMMSENPARLIRDIEVVRDNRPVKPRPLLYLALGCLVGIFAGFVAVFLAHSFGKLQLRLRDIR